ncbi:MAG: GNAT family N-acetyltransferase [Clostridia bacterium]
MEQATPALQMRTLFRMNRRGRIVGSNEPDGEHGPAFVIIRGLGQVAWAVHADVPEDLARELDALAGREPSLRRPEDEPVYAGRYRDLVGGTVYSGPSFYFHQVSRPGPQGLDEIATVTDERVLQVHFSGWRTGEIALGRAPVRAVLRDGAAVSVAFSARWGSQAVEAGVDTAEAFRGQGLAPRVVAAWAQATLALGRLPLYSTSWDNGASRAVARKLDLRLYAAEWALSGRGTTVPS